VAPLKRSRRTWPGSKGRSRPKTSLLVELLESRDLPSGGPWDHIVFSPGGSGGPFQTPGPTGYTPTQIRHAYGFDQISFNNGTVPANGSGTTIAIVDAYDDPNIANDLHQFDQQFGIPDPPTFTKVNQMGGSTPPSTPPPGLEGWAVEIALDVEWSHAIAPGANILLVEANDQNTDANGAPTNLLTAVAYAAAQPGVVAVSMSWGYPEYPTETSSDSVFQTPSGHPGVTFLAASGDSGAPVSYPPASPNVLVGGGTTLNLNASGNVIPPESGWGNAYGSSGGGLSFFEPQPSYQSGLAIHDGTTMISAKGSRANPDVAYDADPVTGFPVYDTFTNPVSTPWEQVGGTSDAAPQWAGLIAIADQGRALTGRASLDGPSQTLPLLYDLPATDFNDITTGSSFGNPLLSAGLLYDLVTGRGTPLANQIVAGLDGQVEPFVQSINRATPMGPVTNATTVAYTVTFSEPVTGVNPTDFTVALTGSVAATTPVAVSGSGAVYTVTVSGITGSGTLGLNLVDNGSIHDLAGNPLTQQNAPAAFEAPQTFATGPGARALALGDLTGNGKPDLVVANRFNPSVSVLLGNGDGTFQAQKTFATSGGQYAVALGDLAGDGKPDLAIANTYGVGVLLGNGNGTFQAEHNFATGSRPYAVAVGDVNGDGRPDLVVTNYNSATVSVLLGNGNGTFQTQHTFATGPNPRSVVLGDLTGDGNLDLVLAGYNSAAVSMLLGNGNGTFQAMQTIGTGAFATSVAVGDVNGDGKPDLAVANSSNGTVSVLLGNGNGTFQAQQAFAAGSFPTGLVLGDVNGDGKPDLAVANPAFDSVSVLLGNGNGTFQARQIFAAGNSPLSIALGDVNGDGRPDLVAADNGSFTVSVLLNAANGDFTGQVYTIADPATHFAISAPSSATAGSGFIFTVMAQDQFNNLVTSYSGTVQFSTSDTQATPPAAATLTGGMGFFAATLKTAGNQTTTASDTTTPSITGASGSILITAAPANHFVVAAAPLPSYPGVPGAYPSPAPASTFASTGTPIVFTVMAEDPFNNPSPTYAGTVQFISSDTAAGVVLPLNSTLTSGMGTFSASLRTPGNQFVTATDASNPTINGATGAIVTRGLVVTSFTPTPSGFFITFNKPFNPSTVLIYTNGTTPDDIVLRGTATQPIAGSALFNSPTAPTSITFVKTDVVSAVGTFNPGSGLLSQGNYTVTLRSYSASTTNGFQDSLGGALDGKDTANPGVNYVYTFSVSAPPTAVGIPDFARGASNTDAVFLPTTIGNGNTFNLIYTNPAYTGPTTGTATVTFSTIAATLQANIQAALNALPQIGLGAGNVPNAVVVANSPLISNGVANVQVTFQNSGFVTATSQLLSSTSPNPVTFALATINAANNIAGNGIPVALSNGQNVTSGSFTLQYNPTLLNITGGVKGAALTAIAGSSFTVTPTINNATSASAVISFSSPSKISSTTASLTLGSLLATVPFSATASYGAKQLLHFSSEQLNTTASSNITVTNQDAVEVAAFFGDVNDTGLPFASSGAVGAMGIVAGLNPNAVQQTLPGFPLFPNLDPVIIGEVNLGGTTNITSLDTNKMNQQLTVGQPTIPWLPAGLPVTLVGPDPTLSVADGGQWTVDGGRWTVTEPVTIDTARPPGSTGMVEAVLALTYDPKVFDVSTADVQLGTVPEGGSGWQLKTEVNAQTGLIGIELFSTTPIQNTTGGSLVTIAMHLRGEPGPSGPAAAALAPGAALTLVPYVDPAGSPRVYQTSVADTQGQFVIHMESGPWPADGTAALENAVDPEHRTSSMAPAFAILEQVFGELAQTAANYLQHPANSLPPIANWQLPTDNLQLLTANCQLLTDNWQPTTDNWQSTTDISLAGLDAFFASAVTSPSSSAARETSSESSP